MQHARPKPFTPTWIFIALAAFGLGLVALAGCTLVSDRLTGVSLNRNGQTTCIKECNDFYKGEFEAEQKRHLEEVERCQTLTQPDRGACLEAEDARHSAAMDALGAAKTECQNTCHRQGQVSGG